MKYLSALWENIKVFLIIAAFTTLVIGTASTLVALTWHHKLWTLFVCVILWLLWSAWEDSKPRK
jgi:hypothetical protein